MNKVILSGFVTSDAVETSINDRRLAYFKLETRKTWTEKTVRKEKFDPHYIVGFDKICESMVNLIKEGREIEIEGELSCRPWLDKDGHERVRYEIILAAFQVFGIAIYKPRTSTGDESDYPWTKEHHK